MTCRFAQKEEIDAWDNAVLSNADGGNFLQSRELAELKKMSKWTPRYVMANETPLTILEKSTFGLGKLWYIPKGPGVTTTRSLGILLPAMKEFARRQGVFAIKIEPELRKTDETLVDLMKLQLVKVRPIQPNFSTVLLDLSPDLETIMTRLNQKGRHAIRRAERDGVTTKLAEATDENCERMYQLLAETAADSFNIRSYSYYKSFWQCFAKVGMGQLFFAYVDDRIVAGAFAIAFGGKGTYKDGGSVRERTVYGASHLLQWRIIEWMKNRDVTVYDLCGAPPSDEINNPQHPHYGIGRFKTSFNKEVTDYIGTYDIVIKPGAYKLWTRFGQRIVTRLHRLMYHEDYY